MRFCRACQQGTGTASIPAAFIRKAKLGSRATTRFMNGRRTSAFKIRIHFCSNGGGNVFWEGDKHLSIYGITVGGLVDLNILPPTFSVCCETRQ